MDALRALRLSVSPLSLCSAALAACAMSTAAAAAGLPAAEPLLGPNQASVEADGTTTKWMPKTSKSLFGRTLYDNPFPEWTALPGGTMVARILNEMRQHDISNPPPSEVEKVTRVVRPVFDAKLDHGQIRMMWMGHASVLVQMEGACIITDPIFSKRCSPVQFAGGPERMVPPPCTVEQLPKLDAVLISHNHYDHLDSNTVSALLERDPDQLFIVPSGLGKWMKSAGCKRVVELMWWERHEVAGLAVTASPAMHWSNRAMYDKQQSLWCGYAVEGLKAGRKFFFTGDTGYTRAFKDIGSILGPFDAAAVPIGAYAPEWFMKNQHVGPHHAVQIHKDIGSKASLAIHWGTFRLTWEPIGEPPELLRQELKAAGLTGDDFFCLDQGGSRTF